MPTDRELAIAALNALREPSDTMLTASVATPVGRVLRAPWLVFASAFERALIKHRLRWRAAIDAALAEHVESVAAGNVSGATRPNAAGHQPRFFWRGEW
jgi:hypothetical protein